MFLCSIWGKKKTVRTGMHQASCLRHTACTSWVYISEEELQCAAKLCDLETVISKEVAQGSNAAAYHLEEGWMWMTAFNTMHCIRCQVYGLASESVVSAFTSSDILGNLHKNGKVSR